MLLVAWLAAVPWTRQRAVSAWRRGRLRRRWDRACRFAGLATVNDRIPRIVRHREVPAGDRLMVRVPKGSERAELEEAAERVAAVLRVRQIRITRDVERADLAHVDVVRRDPFDGTDPRMPARLPWPWRDRRQVSLWDPVPVAVDDMGDTITLSLPGRHVLIGGEPEAGKSTALSAVLAAGALDPNVRLIGLDAKRLELALWRPVFDRLVFNNMGDAIDTLDELIGEMDRRYEHLEQAGRRSWRPSDGPLYLVPIDELRFYTACEDRKAREAFNARAIDLAARGRAAGDDPRARDAEAEHGRGAVQLPGSAGGAVGDALLNAGCLRHDSGRGLGHQRLQRRRDRHQHARRGVAAGRRRPSPAVQELLPE
ncbi:FtsK/SpoIIIE domain-containing protein [Thermomonospora amylolytica]|uniref:FtsK/SpoIIIE domain-containing protein n=1 Tax=Thermomonospora amylolytica TaxID=1411117 RepID=UPI000E6C8C6E|nr:FtsK/SpoIIIE domain-containing protein [Thermomonospora amylolytica]